MSPLGRPRAPRLVRLALAIALALAGVGGAARAADVFSPGDLSRAHAKLSGLDHCTKCHPRGEQLSQARCLECHTELAPRVAQGRGFHGKLAAKDRDCWTCHHEHQGEAAPLVEWGEGGPRRFDHARTGVALGGKHAKVACERCHDPRLVADPAVKELLAKSPRRQTYLGAPALDACARCHFDEHRGQLGPDCVRCHGDAGWKPVPRFDHARTAYPLTGLHARAACAKCHPQVKEPAPGHGALTAPVAADHFTRYRPVAHASCLDCHKDAHEGRFGNACASCHITEGWRKIASSATGGAAGSPGARAFHDRTRYPLLGAHGAVACVSCHGPWKGEPARFKGLPFGACADCHADAHVGQLAGRGAQGAACDRCHTVQGFAPARFGQAEHERTAYPLAGAHRVVACAACHPRDPGLAARVPAPVRAEVERRGLELQISPAVLHLGGDLARCETCHADPHAGQLVRAQGCASCHEASSFRTVRFDHGNDSRFALVGKHARARCASCHRSDPALGGAVRYRPIASACAACHADPHAGQFAAVASAPGVSPEPTTDCTRCHAADDWKKTLFRHEQPFTDYPLTGKHARVACARCHAEVVVAGGAPVRRYRGLPRACAGCHADFHKGAFRGFEPTSLPR